MNKVQAFLLSVWEDLRARRLVPVAVLLVAGIVAVPLLLSKKSEEPVVPQAPTAESSAEQSRGPEELAQVKLDEFKTGSGSSLSAFDASNPFAPPARVLRAARDEAEGEAVPGGETVPGDGGTGDTGTGDTGGDTPDDGTDDGGDDKPQTTEFTYVIDVTFWENGRRRKIEGMEKLDLLPNEASPLLIFMGATKNGGNAVFLVDSTLSTTGEGKCKPSRDDCAFLYLGAGSEQEFTNDEGDSYRLLINQIRKVKVDDGSKASKATKNAKKGKSARAAVGSPVEPRRFVPPVIADLIVESTSDSTGAGERR